MSVSLFFCKRTFDTGITSSVKKCLENTNKKIKIQTTYRFRRLPTVLKFFQNHRTAHSNLSIVFHAYLVAKECEPMRTAFQSVDCVRARSVISGSVRVWLNKVIAVRIAMCTNLSVFCQVSIHLFSFWIK